jgi:phosphoribosyl 1,2-cyclic phosphodiesterase
MKKGFCPLASGSKGNAIFVGTEQTKLLIDVGISVKALKMKLEEIDVDIGEIDAVLITHDHGDHIAGLKTLTSKYGIPVFANHETAKGIVESHGMCPKFKIFSTGEPFEFGDFEIHPFSIPHDTVDPVAFTLKTGSLKLGFCTDLGYVTSLVQHTLQGCHYLYLEANHQPSMVHACSRPMVYKQRVLSKNGHLSNEACGQLLSHIFHSELKHVHLAHLSSECNTPQTALEVVQSILEKHGISIEMCTAPQEKISRAIHF